MAYIFLVIEGVEVFVIACTVILAFIGHKIGKLTYTYAALAILRVSIYVNLSILFLLTVKNIRCPS